MTSFFDHRPGKKLLLFCLVLIWAMFPLVSLAQGEAPGVYQSAQSFADSRNLNVFEEPDLQSKIIGSLIYGESIVIEIGSEVQTESGTWLKIISPFNGYYLKTHAGDGSSQTAGKSEHIDYFSKPASPDQQQTEMAAENEEATKTMDQANEVPAEEDQTSNQLKEYFSDWLDKKKDRFSIGLGLSLITSPEEGFLSSTVIPLDIHLSFPKNYKLLSKARIGLNSISYSGNGNQIALMSVYGAFIVKTDEVQIDDTEVFALIGPAYMSASISGDASGSYQGFGLVVGCGGYYKLSRKIGIGGQWVYFSNQADMGGVQVDIGSKQIQLIGVYSF
ncbi:SH3 domain-containing protein [bacterium]|nr:SH3 domain-containing protein [bacterium]